MVHDPSWFVWGWAMRQVNDRAECQHRPAPLDLGHLRRFTAGNRSLEAEVLGLFAAQAPVTLRVMQLAATEKSWRDAAHTLKGSAYAVGALAIARTAAEAEQARSEPQRWGEILTRLEKAVREAQEFISAAA